jgi:hypothetical protein
VQPAASRLALCVRASDHVHELATNDSGEFIRSVDFDWNALDGPDENEKTVAWSQMIAAFSEILHWLSQSRTPALVAGRVHTLFWWLNPVDAPYKSLSEISRAYSVPRATLSRALILLRDSLGLKISAGKLEHSRAAYREGQIRAVERGTHSSNFTRKTGAAKAPEPYETVMNTSPRSRLKTLDQACQEVEKLEKQLETLRGANPAAHSATKPVPAIAPEQMTLAQLKEKLDAANHVGNQKEVAILYGELCKRRGY